MAAGRDVEFLNRCRSQQPCKHVAPTNQMSLFFEEPRFRSRFDLLFHSISLSNTLSLGSGKPHCVLGLSANRMWLFTRQAKCNALHFALCYRRVCVCLSVCVCECRVCGPQKNGFRQRCRFCFKLRGITPDIIYKSLTQIGLQIQRWQTNGGREKL